jgi:hypothetical protein
MNTQAQYKTSFNADRQPMNTGSVMSRLATESKFTPQFGSATGKQAASDFAKSQQFNDQAQMRRGMEAANATQHALNQTARSELMQAGMANQTKIYSDLAERASSQASLAAKLQEAIITNRAAIASSIMGPSIAGRAAKIMRGG